MTGKFFIGDSEPTSLGDIDRLYSGDELMWPTAVPLRGWILFDTPDLITTWVPPPGVTHVDVCCIGRGGNGRVLNNGGGGGGGGLAWANDIPLDGITSIAITTPPVTNAGNPTAIVFNTGGVETTRVQANTGQNNINTSPAAGGAASVTGRVGTFQTWQGGGGDIAAAGRSGGGGGAAGFNGVGSSNNGSGGAQGLPAAVSGANSGNGGGNSPFGFVSNNGVQSGTSAAAGSSGASGADNGLPLGVIAITTIPALTNPGADFGGGTGTTQIGFTNSAPGRGGVLIRWGYEEKFPAYVDYGLVTIIYPPLPNFLYAFGIDVFAAAPPVDFGIAQVNSLGDYSPFAGPQSWLLGLPLQSGFYELGGTIDGTLPTVWHPTTSSNINTPVLSLACPEGSLFEANVWVRRVANQAIVKQIIFGNGVPGVPIYTPPAEGSPPNRMGSLIFLNAPNMLQTKDVFHNAVNQFIGTLVASAFEFRVNFVSGAFEGGSSSPLNTWMSVAASYNARTSGSNYVTLKVEVRRQSDQAIVSTWWIRLDTNGGNTNSWISYSPIA